ncbi:3-hydroxybutyryl-CoA dehydrogenase [Actinocorallia herbida]|uniref:3-hydroxybutyryl-CoA dehydrogenase n=1 Tax=Actinocorallia herbida TaxID=58109 RepID=A0A3N1D8I5_9ACTN|nr:3-hydroxyacyl-CoA dehydrogenase family protein [Actinocorallia herbida]ROO89842.1 3-hydroxybutyryl-CoA dehydrogenase [Actinocorallia herbida]
MGFGKVGVVGLGTMGAGIAEVLARGGVETVGVEINDAALERGRSGIEGSTTRAVTRGKLTEEARDQILGRITFSTDFGALADCDLVIEAVPELIALKAKVFAQLDEVCRPDAVLATNTSSLSVTEIAAATSRPESIVGVHFFNPAPVMKLVEVIHSERSRPEFVAAVTELVGDLGKVPVTIGDRAGFVANRLLFGLLGPAAQLAETGVAKEDIDASLKAIGLPMGPLTLMDLIGLDTCLEVLEAVHADSGSPRHEPAGILRKLVDEGSVGRKSGGGFYTYDRAGSGTVVAPVEGTASAEIAEQLYGPYLQDAAEMVRSGYCTAADADAAMTLGCGFPVGPISALRERGAWTD